jgi:hypothetical protein
MPFVESNPDLMNAPRMPEGVPVPDPVTFSANPDTWLLLHWIDLLFLAIWAAVLVGLATILWRSRHWIGDRIISALAKGEKARRQVSSGLAELRRKVDERAS